MELILLVLREFRYFFKSKKIKKYITIVLIILLLLFFYNRVFAVDFSDFPDFPEYYYQNQCDHYFIFYDHSNDKYTLVFWAGTSAIEKNGYIYPGVTNNSYFGGSYEISSSSLSNGGSWGDYSHPDAPRGYYYNHNSNRDYLYSNDNIYYEDGSVFMSANVFNKVAPFITNEVGSIESWNFESFEFDSGEYSYFDNVSVKFYYSIDNTNWQQAEIFSLDTESDYVVRDDPFSETFTANIPRSEIFKNFSLKTGDYIGFEIFYKNQSDYYGPYQLTVSNSSSGSGSGSNTSVQDYTNQFSNLENSINGTTQAIESQTNAINGTTQAVNDTNDFLKDNTVDDSQFNLPTVDVNDPTANFFDTIFMGLYNAVTNNEEKTISLEILGNNINISSADFNYLNGNEWNVLRIILSSMWVFGIGIYILKDIRKMIDKIKDGNVENMATDDIKANMV